MAVIGAIENGIACSLALRITSVAVSALVAVDTRVDRWAGITERRGPLVFARALAIGLIARNRSASPVTRIEGAARAAAGEAVVPIDAAVASALVPQRIGARAAIGAGEAPAARADAAVDRVAPHAPCVLAAAAVNVH